MVPQLVPIEKATKAAKAKTVAGKMEGEAGCPRVSIKYLPLFKSWQMFFKPQARVKMTMGRILPLTPSHVDKRQFLRLIPA